MSVEEFTIWMRLANTALALTVLVAFLVRFNYRVYYLGPRSRLIWVAISGLLLAIAYGSAESYIQHAPLGARSYLLNASLTLLLYGLWRSRRAD